jgi:arabinose-5-phosphate isomerase
VERGDVVIAISHSGETAELMAAVDVLQDRGVRLIAVVGEADSPLGRAADCVLDAAVAREGGPLELAPRASTAAQVAVVAALAAELQERWGQTRADYARLHPAGALGRKARGSAGPGPGSGPS